MENDLLKTKILQEAMDLISMRRLKFSNYISHYVAVNKLNSFDEKLSEAYLSGIDDANRIILFLMGEGPDIASPDFFKKAQIHKPSDYGVHNLTEKEKTKYQVDNSTVEIKVLESS